MMQNKIRQVLEYFSLPKKQIRKKDRSTTDTIERLMERVQSVF